MRVMAVDYGDARTGVAVSDLTGTLAGEAWVIEEWNSERLADTLAAAYAARGCGRLVVGCPLNMDGTAGERAEKCRAFGALLAEKTGAAVVMWDERRTTVDAYNILTENRRFGKKRKAAVDAVAATLILEGYLGALRRKEADDS